MGASPMRLRSLILLTGALGLSQAVSSQSPTYGLGKSPTAEEIRAWDIAVSPTGKELPPGIMEARKKARRFTPRSVRYATGQRGMEDGLLS